VGQSRWWRRAAARRRRATYTRPQGVWHLLAAYDLSRDRLYGHISPAIAGGVPGLHTLCAVLYPPGVPIAIVLDNASAHLSTKRDTSVGDWAAGNNVEFAYVPTSARFLNRIEAQFTALPYFTLDGTDHRNHEEQGSMIRQYMAWRTGTPTTSGSAKW
jgi:hypothetical protein